MTSNGQPIRQDARQSQRGLSAIDKVLSRYPGPVTISSLTRRSVIRVFLQMGLIWAAAGLIVLVAKSDLAFALFIIMFGGIPGVLVSLIPGAGRIVINAAGFETTSLFNTWSTTWGNVDRFEVIASWVRGQRFVVNCVAHRPPPNQDPAKLVIDRYFLSRSADGEDLSPQELAELMTLWKERALRPSTNTAVAPSR